MENLLRELFASSGADPDAVDENAPMEPAEYGACLDALKQVREHLEDLDCIDLEEDDAAITEVLGFVIWSLGCHALRAAPERGEDEQAALHGVASVVDAELGGQAIWDADLAGILEGESVWLDRYGDLH